MSDQYRFIRNQSQMYLDAQVVLETNKRVIVRFEDDLECRAFCRDMTREDFAASMRKGRQSTAYYAQVILH